MANDTATLKGKQVLVIVGDGFEDLELWYPVLRLREAGATVTLAGPQKGATYHGKHGLPAESDAQLSEVKPAEFDALVVPGGWMPDKLRRDEQVLAITRHFAESGKPLASICHGPQILISAGVCKGVKMTSTRGVKDDVVNAGAEWVDAEVVVDRNFVSSRVPPDLPAFCRELIAMMAKAR